MARAAAPDPFRFRTLPLRAKGTWLAHAFKAVAKQHHAEMRPLFRRLVPPDGVVLDVGGHSGQFATLFARLVPEGRVYSFEPGSYALSLLHLAVRANRIANVTIRPQGLSDAPGEAALTVPVKAKGSVRFGLSHMGPEAGGRITRAEPVAVITIDAFAAEVGLTRLDLVKADIEGWEMRMLAGGERTLRRLRPVLMLEMADAFLARAGDSLEAAWRMLESWGYAPFRWAGGDRLVPLDGLAEGDIFWCHRDAASVLWSPVQEG